MFPAIPSTVYSALGPVPVTIVADLVDGDGEALMGLWLPESRTIQLRAGMNPIATFATLLHERVHQILWDSGAKPLDEDEEERICDAISTALVAEMIGQLPREP